MDLNDHARPGSMNTATGGARIIGGTQNHEGPGPEIMAADTLEDDSVVNRAGEKLGKIERIMLDVRRGRVAYAVLGSGGLLGMGEKLFAVPWNALTLDADRECFVLDIAKERLEQAQASITTTGRRWSMPTGRTKSTTINTRVLTGLRALEASCARAQITGVSSSWVSRSGQSRVSPRVAHRARPLPYRGYAAQCAFFTRLAGVLHHG